MKVITRCNECQRQYDTNTIYGGCPYCLRRQIMMVPKHIREAEQDAHHSAVWNSIMNSGAAGQ